MTTLDWCTLEINREIVFPNNVQVTKYQKSIFAAWKGYPSSFVKNLVADSGAEATLCTIGSLASPTQFLD